MSLREQPSRRVLGFLLAGILMTAGSLHAGKFVVDQVTTPVFSWKPWSIKFAVFGRAAWQGNLSTNNRPRAMTTQTWDSASSPPLCTGSTPNKCNGTGRNYNPPSGGWTASSKLHIRCNHLELGCPNPEYDPWPSSKSVNRRPCGEGQYQYKGKSTVSIILAGGGGPAPEHEGWSGSSYAPCKPRPFERPEPPPTCEPFCEDCCLDPVSEFQFCPCPWD